MPGATKSPLGDLGVKKRSRTGWHTRNSGGMKNTPRTQPMTSENNKRIAKNTLMLYFRMLLIMGVSLYTVRIVLDALLGVVDYGIFNVVAGVVTMFSFLGGTMTSASQRFFSFELGRNDQEKLRKTFSTTLTIYGIIALLIVLITETIGLWFLNHKMVIPADRMVAARWVYHFSILSFVMTVITIPYQSVLIAREKMNVYAYMSILEVLLKLLVVYLLIFFSTDKLKLYAVLTFVSTLIITFLYRIYCLKKFDEATFKFSWDKKLLTEILSYAGWNMIGAIANILKANGTNILLNLFFGPVINAARGISYQIGSAVNSFIINFYMAVRPQITKAYAAGDYKYYMQLVFRSSKYSYFLLLLLSLPLMLETDFILTIWLKNVPPNIVLFTRLMVLNLLIESMNNQLVAALQASGKIKKYQSVISIMLLFILPISYILFLFGASPESTFYVSIGVTILCFVPQLWIVHQTVGLSIKSYLKEVTFVMILVSVIAIILPLFLQLQMDPGIIRFFSVCIVGVLSCLVTVYLFGLTSDERTMIISYINRNIFKKDITNEIS